jgi:hypothetical protein
MPDTAQMNTPIFEQLVEELRLARRAAQTKPAAPPADNGTQQPASSR